MRRYHTIATHSFSVALRKSAGMIENVLDYSIYGAGPLLIKIAAGNEL